MGYEPSTEGGHGERVTPDLQRHRADMAQRPSTARDRGAAAHGDRTAPGGGGGDGKGDGRTRHRAPASRRVRATIWAALCLCTLPGLAGVQWDRAMPFQGPANPSWQLTITGSFSAGATYKCKFSPLETEGNPIETGAFSPAAGATSLVCDTPQWTYAAQRSRLSVIAAATAAPIAGPGGTAEVITYVSASSHPAAHVFFLPDRHGACADGILV
jgi:hypothetical protein